MREQHVELLIIGWGKGGKTLARQAALAGRSVAIAERSREMIGGTCINIGCVPSKALLHDAGRRREDDDPAASWRAAVERRDALTGKLRERNRELITETGNARVLLGHAAFTGPRTVQIETAEGPVRVTADAVCINTGAVPSLPDVPGAALSGRVHDATTIQHIDPFPERLVIVGAGHIGLEFATMFAAFGASVTVLNRSERILPREEAEAAAAVEASLTEAGARILHGAQLTRIDEREGHVEISWAGPDGTERSELASAVLLATGRRAMTDGLDLERAGIELDERGFIAVDDRLRTSAPGVYALGDVNGGPQHTYISLDDARIVADELWGDGRRHRGDRVAVPSVLFTNPPLARAGITSHEARERGLDVRTASRPVSGIAAMPLPKIQGNPRGTISFVVDAQSDLVLGATLLHLGSEELVNLIALAMRHGVTASELRDGIYAHPSASEALNEVLAALS